MFNYDGQICPVCGQPFDKDSDIVVCPECGTPHHRRCWEQLGHCANRDKHREGFEWKPIVKEPPAGSITCPNCGAVMPRGTLFCENCGHNLDRRTKPPVQSENGGYRPAPRYPGQNYENDIFAQRRRQERRRIERALSGEIDGVPVRDLAVYIGTNSQYYIYKFKKMDRNPAYKPFCFSAFMFSPLWYMYRKMWKVAGLSALFNFAMNIPYLIIMANQMGILPSSSPLLFNGIDTVAMICSLAVMVVGMWLGFKAIPWYRKAATDKLKELKLRSGGDNNAYAQMVFSRAGPSKLAMLIISLLAAYYIFSMLFQ